ncbi:MAG: hypothetical protein A2087_06425 [Spirochaetes bacterium GWD1_61_31]|nr:MAG: hypothetical protein A2Y37_09045 [Spirochaetes bacterium GWB1_60_80]OHD31368.1 MAG: hypothetical protein A2004_13330 [Spirochaetes bacterium GWC1_61_12]OHD39988.1 MAG: hypothetical protein A2087_06425 [Spirochaetes bacterium GWD1_61_31]OHD42358.1 MAG: hypothetical protein A2Y35_11575 [Spirochaetes bacterium GWE1_60_18]OHD60530.1 MAG: hypothetical protein A2Y32_03790 [Spirochaetes bacterium GWF1_60_12]HAW86400.1 hypothetical protein [Spirochaetaceae bacterium]
MTRRLLGLAACAWLTLSGLAAGTFTFTADSMNGSMARGRERTILQGNASIVSDGLVIKANRIELYGSDFRFAECSGSVQIIDEAKELLLTTENLYYDRELKISRLTGPSAMEDRQNNLVIRGNYIENDEVRELVVIQINVRIIKDKLICRAEFARYDRKTKILELTGSPLVTRDTDTYQAARITVNIDTEDIRLEGRVSGSVIQTAPPASETGDDATVPPADSTVPPTDAAAPATDTTMPPTNTTVPATDTSTPPATGTGAQL